MSRLVFLGTPVVAAATLEALCDEGHDVALVISAPDRRRSRAGAPTPSPVKASALARGLAVSERVADVTECGAELGVVVAFGRLVPSRVLAVVPMVNIHFSLLPRWRGAAPVEWAILAGDAETGVSLMAIGRELDTGPVYEQRRVRIGESETAAALTARLGALGTAMLLERLRAGLGEAAPQRGESSYARKLETADLELDFRAPAELVARTVRVGRAWTTFRDRRLLVHVVRVLDTDLPGPPGTLNGARVATGAGSLELVEVQEQGRAALSFAAWAVGARPREGETFTRTVATNKDGR